MKLEELDQHVTGRRRASDSDAEMQEYWRPLLVKHLAEGKGSDQIVPESVAVSVRVFGPDPGTTFDEGSVLRVLERCLQARGKHERRPTEVDVRWNEIQSITFSHKAP